MRAWFSIFAAALGAGLVAIPSAHATVLLDLINPGGQTDAPYTLAFTATMSSTILSVGGYQVPTQEEVQDNSVQIKGGGPNLLGGSWAYTPAALGSGSETTSDGAVPALIFYGIQAGDYDTYSQTFGTTVGDTYNYSFEFSNDLIEGDSSPSGLLVTVDADAATASVPEPFTLSLFGAGLAGAAALRRRKKKAQA